MLLTRDQFRESTFERDSHKCVICHSTAQDAHHIIERRLFPDGGYYLDNGSSLCGKHHIEAEQTTLSCEEIREAAGIKRAVLPPHLYRDQLYDKWGNAILENGLRLRGEMFEDESVQKILKRGNVLKLFTKYVKYPRTYHLPWSPGVTKDDRMMDTLDRFEGEEVVVMVKMDGENTTMYKDYLHARSIEYSPHPSRDRVKALHSQIGYNIPEDWRICGENLYAKHSIHYKNLPDYFLMFSAWDNNNQCLSWTDTKEWADLLGLGTVPTIYEGIWDEKLIKDLHKDEHGGDECEGYVVRIADSFHYKQFRQCVGKYVRKGHVHTHGHWMRSEVVPNLVEKVV